MRLPGTGTGDREQDHRVICETKARWSSWRNAEIAAKELGRKYRYKLWVYRCPYCGFNHVTRKDPALWDKTQNAPNVA